MKYLNQEAIDAANMGEEFPERLQIDGEDAFTLEYHATDGWRGYYDAVPVEGSGWERIEEGSWVTGDHDDAPEYARSSVVEAKVERLETELDAEGYDLAVVFAPTSNVFSTGYDLFKRQRAELDEDADTKAFFEANPATSGGSDNG